MNYLTYLFLLFATTTSCEKIITKQVFLVPIMHHLQVNVKNLVKNIF